MKIGNYFLMILASVGFFACSDSTNDQEIESGPVSVAVSLSGLSRASSPADIVTPNLTELCILTDTDYRMIENMTDEKH